MPEHEAGRRKIGKALMMRCDNRWCRMAYLLIVWLLAVCAITACDMVMRRPVALGGGIVLICMLGTPVLFYLNLYGKRAFRILGALLALLLLLLATPL